MGRIEVRYLVNIRGRWRWQPGRHLRRLGFHSCDLGEDMADAVAKAQKLNKEADEYRRGQREALPATPGTVDFWLDAYRKSPEFKRLAPKTKRSYDQCADAVSKWAGDHKPKQISRKAIRVWYRSMYEGNPEATPPRRGTPAKANAIMRFLRLWMEWLTREGELDSNPAAKPGLIGTNPRQQLWTEEQVLAFVSAADQAKQPSIGLAVLLGYNLGQREGDLLKLAWSRWDGEAFEIKQGKTGAPVRVPATTALKTALAAAPRRGPLILTTDGHHKAFGEHHFRHLFAEIRALAALPAELKFMDLRRTAVVRLARAGCTIPEIAAITGHSLKAVHSILEVYLPRDGEMASAAIIKLERKEAKGLTQTG